MKTAFDDIRKITYRALDGAGVPAGIADDSAWAAAMLAAAGHDSLTLVADALDGLQGSHLSFGLTLPDEDDGRHAMNASGRSAVFLAPGISDYAAASRQAMEVSNLNHGLFLLPFAMRANRYCTSDLVPEVADVKIVPGRPAGTDDFYATVNAAVQAGIEVNPNAHARVYAYSRAILVPETEESRLKGAGAGLTDND